MGNSDKENYHETLGLSPDATLDEVKKRYRELNDAYLKILELSRNKNANPPKQPAPNAVQAKPKQASQETHTEPIAAIKERFAKKQINETQFGKLVKERYEYLKNKPFIDLTDSEFEERLKGFDGLKLDPKYLEVEKSSNHLVNTGIVGREISTIDENHRPQYRVSVCSSRESLRLAAF